MQPCQRPRGGHADLGHGGEDVHGRIGLGSVTGRTGLGGEGRTSRWPRPRRRRLARAALGRGRRAADRVDRPGRVRAPRGGGSRLRAKYATKAAETSGTLDRRVRRSDLARLEQQGVTEHAARLIRTAWHLGDTEAHPELAPLRLRQWAHMLGFRGHFSTKSRAYSTTMTALRRVRLEYRQARDLERLPYDPAATLVLANWRYAGQGYTAGESALASSLSHQGGTVGR
ncbi:replication initiator [Streptosporangium sp. NPDC087985]|uniref:replication initiator n=1 Tax=Streptosporangium sp. NPDC087985 TaxID=3366196 RepID=UPI00381F585D